MFWGRCTRTTPPAVPPPEPPPPHRFLSRYAIEAAITLVQTTLDRHGVERVSQLPAPAQQDLVVAL